MKKMKPFVNPFRCIFIISFAFCVFVFILIFWFLHLNEEKAIKKFIMFGSAPFFYAEVIIFVSFVSFFLSSFFRFFMQDTVEVRKKIEASKSD